MLESKFNNINSYKGPIFIMGCQRSGTSALWRALIQHPSLKQQGPEDDGRPVTTMKELWFLKEFFLGREANSYRPHEGSEIDNEFTIRFAKLVDSFCRERYAVNQGRWISANPSDSLYIDQILKLFSDAKIIFLCRHPQEIIWSSAHAPWIKNMNRIDFLLYTQRNALWWRRFGQICLNIQNNIYGNNVLLVRNEDMIFNPFNTSLKILRYLDEIYDKSVTRSISSILNSSFINNNMSNNLINRTRLQIGKDVSFCKNVVVNSGDLMEKLSYDDLSGKFNPPSKFYKPFRMKYLKNNDKISLELKEYFQRHPIRSTLLYRLLRMGK